MKIRIKNKSGFTLVELIVAIGIGIFTGMMVIMILTPGLRYVEKVKKIERLHSNAVFLLNKMSYHIRQAKEIEDIVNPTKLEITQPSSLVIKKEGEDIKFGTEILNVDNIKVRDLSFSKISNSIRLSLTLETDDSKEDFSATTTIAYGRGL